MSETGKDPLKDLGDDIDKALEKHRPKPEKNISTGAHAGIEFAVSVILPPLIGYALDNALGTKPALFLGLLGLGICTAFYSVYRLTLPAKQAPGEKQTDRLPIDQKGDRNPADTD